MKQAEHDGTERTWVAVAAGQGLYYLVTGVWPWLSMRTFERVTGPKADRWLVKTVGLLVGVIGAVLLLAARRGRRSPELELLAGGSAAGLAAIEAGYVSRGRISPVYLMDAVAEAVLVGGWLITRRGDRRSAHG